MRGLVVESGVGSTDHVSDAVFYDAECPFCVRTAQRFSRVLTRRGLVLLPLQTQGAAKSLGVPHDQLLDEMKLRLHDGTVIGGADAVAEIARRIWWAWPLWLLSRLPGAMPPMRAVYRWVARNRGCPHGACAVETPLSIWPMGVLPLFLLPAIAILFSPSMTPWVLMWALAFALYAGCKWLTFWEAWIRGFRPSKLRSLGYLLAWPGMDAASFFDVTARVPQPGRAEWLMATLKILLGIALTGVAATAAMRTVHPLLTGWLGLIGLAFVLHFGMFHILSLAWRGAGVDAAPVMQNPLRSKSLAEFWGRRWNTAFHELAARFTFRPVRKNLSPSSAALLVFFASGLIHDFVISLPAGGGFGLPTTYFLLQGLASASERSKLGRRFGLGRGWRGRLFALSAVAVPAFWLFHPPFIQNVVLPMLAVIGKLERNL